ncbi:MAG: TolC family protein [Sedimentisphaerales bacterium]|nr:TolC family protein [Sedimentisphaerales bacterium]
MRYHFTILTIIILSILSKIAPGAAIQANNANNLTRLEDYLEFAALNNAGLQSIFEQWKTAVEQIPQSESLPDPKFTYGYFIKEIETRTGPQRQRFGLLQTFPWFGKIEARTDVASANAKAAHKRYEAAKFKLFYEVKDSFYEYVYLGQAVEIAKQNLELLKHFEEVARTRYTASAGSHPDIIRAQIELAMLDNKLKTLEQMRRPLVAHLDSLLNRRSETLLPWPEKPEYNLIKIDRSKAIAIMIANNPQLQELDFELASAKAAMELAKKKFYPDINIGLDWIQTDEALSAGVRDSGKDPIIAMLSLNLPVWTDSYKAAQIQARAQMRSRSAKKLQSQNDLAAQLEKTLFEFEDSAGKIELYQEILLPKAKEMLEASEVAYRAGTIDFLSLIDAQRTLLEFNLSLEKAITNNLQKTAQIEMLMGVDSVVFAGQI